MRKHKIRTYGFLVRVFNKIKDGIKWVFGFRKKTVEETLSSKEFMKLKAIEDFEELEGYYFERRGHLNKVKLVGFHIDDDWYPDWFWTFVTNNYVITNCAKEGSRMINVLQPAVGKNVALSSRKDFVLIDENLKLRVISTTALKKEYDWYGKTTIKVQPSSTRSRKVDFI